MSNTKGLLPRQGAWEVLQSVAAGAYADVALDRAIKKYSLLGSDRSLLTELAYGAIRNRYLLDCWIDYLGKKPAKKQPPLLRWLLHIGIYQIIRMKKIPVSAAINTSVEIAKTGNLKNLAPVVNGLLRAVNRAYIAEIDLPLPESFQARIRQEYSLPNWLVAELISWFGESQAEIISRAFNNVPSFDLRVNRIRETPFELQKQLAEVGIESSLMPDFPDGLSVEKGLRDLNQWPGYTEGKWCVQDRSSQWVAPLLEPQPGERILDACAAPGSKTTHLAELIGNDGEIWAVDRSLSRLKLVTENATRLGTDCINVLEADSLKLLNIRPDWEGYFHRILIDAPCSGLGTLSRNPDARWRLTPMKIRELTLLQEKLLKSIVPLLKPGGRMVYSTCSIHPEENSRQIERFLSTCSDMSLKKEKQILPDTTRQGDGFYAAILELN